MERIPFIRENACGQEITGIRYMTEEPTDKWVIFYHGIGEVGPLDGSQLIEIERHGYPKHAKAGLNLPFNILALQSHVNHYAYSSRVVIPHLISKYGAKAIVQTGLSMGGIGTWNMLWWDVYEKLRAIVPVCGTPQWKDPATGTINYAGARPIPVLAVHGDKDTTSSVTYRQGVAAMEALNAAHPGQGELITLPGVAHNAWDQAYDVTGEVGKRVLAFIVDNLRDVSSDYQKGFSECQSMIIQYTNSLRV